VLAVDPSTLSSGLTRICPLKSLCISDDFIANAFGRERGCAHRDRDTAYRWMRPDLELFSCAVAQHDGTARASSVACKED